MGYRVLTIRKAALWFRLRHNNGNSLTFYFIHTQVNNQGRPSFMANATLAPLLAPFITQRDTHGFTSLGLLKEITMSRLIRLAIPTPFSNCIPAVTRTERCHAGAPTSRTGRKTAGSYALPLSTQKYYKQKYKWCPSNPGLCVERPSWACHQPSPASFVKLQQESPIRVPAGCLVRNYARAGECGGSVRA